MYCTNCGAPNADDAAFCTTCGTALTPPANEQAPPVEQFQAAPPPPPQAYAQPAPPEGQVPYPPQDPAAYPPQAPYGYPPQAPPKKKNKGLMIGIIAGAAVLVVALVLILVLGGGGGSKGVAGKWTVVDTEGWSDYEEGLILNFKSNGQLTYEAPAGTPDDMKAIYDFMNLLKTSYKVSGDTIVLTAEFFGEKDVTEMRFSLEGDQLTLYDGSDVTVLRRAK